MKQATLIEESVQNLEIEEDGMAYYTYTQAENCEERNGYLISELLKPGEVVTDYPVDCERIPTEDGKSTIYYNRYTKSILILFVKIGIILRNVNK